VRNVELDGQVPDLAQIQALTSRNYGHFTSMQVRGGKVRGLALHMARLDDGNETFFGARMDVTDEHRVRELIRHALGGAADASVRVTMVPGPSEKGPPGVLVAVSDPVPDRPADPRKIMTTVYERAWPEHKHLATMPQVVHRRRAQRAGFHDALFVGPDGHVREGTTWNIAFWDGGQVVWPHAPMLKGVTMVLLQIAMTMTGVPWTLRPVDTGELPDLLAAAASNSGCAAQPIALIDGIEFTATSALTGVLTDAWAGVPWDEL
jgi:branched-subunit amino acid aminotransferase/4-amino-4-deoxychorismate lyase